MAEFASTVLLLGYLVGGGIMWFHNPQMTHMEVFLNNWESLLFAGLFGALGAATKGKE